jgi:thimet oligopeptidase
MTCSYLDRQDAPSRLPTEFMEEQSTLVDFAYCRPSLQRKLNTKFGVLVTAGVMSIGFNATAAASLLDPDTGIDWTPTAAGLTAVCRSSIDAANARIKVIEQSQPTSFGSGLGAIEAASADLNDATISAATLAQLATSKEVRDASNKCDEDLAAFGVQLSADPAVYKIAKASVPLARTQPEKQLVKLYLESGRRVGAGLSKARRDEVTHRFDQLNHLTLGFQQELSEESSTIHITPFEAESLPPEFQKTLKSDAAGFVVPVDESTLEQVMGNEESREARHRYYDAYLSRGGPSNVKRLADAVRLRDEIAHLLGFKSWAAYQLDAKMAKTPERALALLRRVDEASLPKARAEIAVLAAMKANGGDASPFRAWDYGYFEKLLERKRYAVDTEAIRPFFPVTKVVPAVFAIYEKLLSVKFEEIQPAMAWAPDVTEYDIVDVRTGAPIAWFYLDLYPREGKYTHFATFPLRAGRVLPDGRYQKPVGAVVGNWPVAAAGRPSLLSHDDVITFFHEFGHLMHHCLTLAPFESEAGTNVRSDFVEAPSQMLENWMWQPSILKEVSSNVSTGEPLPDDMIQKMIAVKHVSDGVRWARQAFFGTYDLALHSNGPHVDPTQLFFYYESRMTVFAGDPGTVPEASFGHLMSGYDAGYYGYLWSLVFAQDMFTDFENEGLESPVIGARYRHDILEKGATEEPDVLLREFMGRPMKIDAFYDYLGIDPAKVKGVPRTVAP